MRLNCKATIPVLLELPIVSLECHHAPLEPLKAIWTAMSNNVSTRIKWTTPCNVPSIHLLTSFLLFSPKRNISWLSSSEHYIRLDGFPCAMAPVCYVRDFHHLFSPNPSTQNIPHLSPWKRTRRKPTAPLGPWKREPFLLRRVWDSKFPGTCNQWNTTRQIANMCTYVYTDRYIYIYVY